MQVRSTAFVRPRVQSFDLRLPCVTSGLLHVKLPFAEQAVIEDTKLRYYLLSPIHPVGRYKCRFFLDIGYETSHWEVLRQDLLSLVATEDAQEGIRTRYGQKYVVRGILKAPSGTLAHIVTVWIVLHGELIPRFVTAYPGSE